jgi:hypothetical protein
MHSPASGVPAAFSLTRNPSAPSLSLSGLKSPRKKPIAAKLRRWRVSILRQRADNLGTNEARDAKAAEAEAVKVFGLSEEERKLLSILEWRGS